MTRKQAIATVFFATICLVMFVIVIKQYFSYSRNKRKSLESFAELISEVSEMIIPRTESPGAKDANVSDFIIKALTHCNSKRDRGIVIAGLIDLENYSIRHFNRSFINCSEAEKTKSLQYFEIKGTFSNSFLNRVKLKVLGPSFFEILKKLTIDGFCTSMLGATQALAYDKTPGRYLPCHPYRKNQKSWASK